MKIFSQIENEINDYLLGNIEISEGYKFSEYKLKKRIMLYANQVYPKGKIDKQGNYKYWIDISQPRIDAEVKNIDFDTKDISYYSDVEKDAPYMILCNLSLKEWLKDNNQATEFNEAIEEGSGWGNVVWKKVKGGYERWDAKNFYVINQQAKTLDDSPVIERHILTQSDLRDKSNVYKQIDEVIKNCGNKGFSQTPSGINESKETPYYEIYERNGEVSEETLFEAQGKKKKGSPDKYLLAKIVVAGLKKGGEKSGKYVLYAEPLPGMMSDIYKEYHRGRYNGRWFRTGIYELLFDIQTRANAISNQIAAGLEFASKALFRSKDRLLANNIITDLNNGDVIKSEDLQQITVRMEGMDQLVADWNRLMTVADKLCNSYEVVTGENLPSATPFKLANQQNNNANKLFDFLREKLSIALQSVFEDWIMPDQIKHLKAKDVLRLTGDPDKLQQYFEMLVNAWYIKNLLALPPHTPEIAQTLKDQKMQEIKSKKDHYITLEKGWLDGVKPRIRVVINGENVNLAQDLETLSSFITLEQDPVRRTALIEMAMKKKNIDVSELPKSPPQPLPTQQPQQNQLQPQPQQKGKGNGY